MPFPKQIWENLPSKETPINAERLNLYEDHLFYLTNRNTHSFNIDIETEEKFHKGYGTIQRIGHWAQINLTITTTSGYSEEIFDMPQGFIPLMDFDSPLTNVGSGKIMGSISYSKETNRLFLQNAGTPILHPCKITVAYLCEE